MVNRGSRGTAERLAVCRAGRYAVCYAFAMRMYEAINTLQHVESNNLWISIDVPSGSLWDGLSITKDRAKQGHAHAKGLQWTGLGAMDLHSSELWECIGMS